MSDVEQPLTDTPEPDNWKTRYEDLARQTATLRVAVLVGSLTLTAFLYVQSRFLGKDVTNLRSNLKQVTESAAKDATLVQVFATKLLEYGQAHPEFNPVLNKYGIRQGQFPASTNRSPVSPTAPLPPPTAPVAPKK